MKGHDKNIGKECLIAYKGRIQFIQRNNNDEREAYSKYLKLPLLSFVSIFDCYGRTALVRYMDNRCRIKPLDKYQGKGQHIFLFYIFFSI